MRASRAGVALRQRLETLDKGLDASLDTDAEGLHRTRVATRRLREALPLIVSVDDTGAVTDFRDIVRDATRALGGVREIDVALTLVDAITNERPDLAAALEGVREAMTAERLARLDRMRRQLDAPQLQRASRDLAQRMRGLVDDRRPVELLAERLADRIETLRGAIDDAGLLYAAERLHRIRLATKKLRYVLELVAEMRVASTKRVVNDLKRVQDCLGRLHDLETVTRVARHTLGPMSHDEPVAPVLSLLEDKIHAEHAEYLSLRGRLNVVLERATMLVGRIARTQVGA